MAHNVVYYDTSTNSIQQFSTAQIDELSERILRIMAAGTYTGSMTVGTTNPIGTFVDTALVGSPGSTNTTVVSNTYTISQVTTATLGASSNPPLYLGLDTSGSPTISLQENLTTKEQLADEILTRMVTGTGGTNAYYLSPTAPADGGTWVSMGNLVDTQNNLTSVVTTYQLWKRTTSNATLTNRNPLELVSNQPQMFTDAEVQAFIKTIEERIVATGVGTYALQASVPATGTWVNCGTATDTRFNTVTNTFNAPTNFEGAVFNSLVNYTETYETIAEYTGATFTAFSTYTTAYNQLINYDTTYLGNTYQPSYLISYLQNLYTTDGSYIGPTQLAYAGTNTYDGPIRVFEAGLNAGEYINIDTYTGSPLFDGPGFSGGPDISYTITYVLNISYDTDYILDIPYEATYVGPGFIGYDTDYQGTLSYQATYTGIIPYDVLVVGTTSSTISTRTLWRRIA